MMDDKRKLEPQIRFRGFTGDWEKRKLSELGTLARGKSKHRPRDDNRLYGGDYPFIQTGDVAKAGLYLDSFSQTYSEFGIQQSKLWNEGALLITIAANIADSTILAIKAAFPDSIIGFETKNNDVIFIKFALDKARDYFRSRVETSSQANLNQAKLSELNFIVPTNPEQTAIGNFFRTLDTTITLHKRKLDGLRKLKKAYLQQMFPQAGENVPRLRFKGFTGDWEQRKLRETLNDLKSGLSRMLSDADIGLPVIRANNINHGNLNLMNDIKYWYADDPQGAKTENYLVHSGDILINFINSEAKMGTAAIVEEEPARDTIYTTNILKAQTNDEYDSYFWFALTQTGKYKTDIKIITKPAVNQASFTTVDFKALEYRFPYYPEQTAIGNFFRNLDNQITSQTQKLEQLKKLKATYLQKMFI